MQDKERHINHWEQDWLEGKLSSEEAAIKAENALEFSTLSKYVEGYKAMNVANKTSKAEAWTALESKINSAQESNTKVIPINRNAWFIGIAASFTLLMGALYLLNLSKEIRIETGYAESEMIYLPDSSIIYLNANSQVSYSEKGWNQSRELTLDGEAFFEVKRGSNFAVNTENGVVEVLGTSFNIRSREIALNVACKTGKVRVSNDQNQVILTPGLSTRLKKGKLIDPIAVSVESVDSWRKGESFLDGATLQEAFNELERLFNVKVIHDLPQTELEGTGTFYIDTKNLKEAVQSISLPKGLMFEMEDKEVTYSYK